MENNGDLKYRKKNTGILIFNINLTIIPMNKLLKLPILNLPLAEKSQYTALCGLVLSLVRNTSTTGTVRLGTG